MGTSSEHGGRHPPLLGWLIERAPFGVAFFALDGTVDLNSEAARIAGMHVRHTSFNAWLEHVQLCDQHGTVVPQAQRPASIALGGRRSPRQRMQVVRSDGTRVPTAVEAFPWPEEGDGVQAAVVLIEDISWILETERLDSEWLGALGHELNGSIQHVLASTTAAQLYAARDAKRVVHHLESAQRQARLMRRLVRDFVDGARLRAGIFDCRDETFPIAGLLREMVDAAETADPRHRILLEAEEDAWVRADVDRTKQVLTNLLSNAAKYSTPGLLVLGAVKRGDSVVIFLRDEGPGIARNVQAQLFDRYRRLPSRQEGSGMGLWIARELARRMGGELWVESDDGRPTTFFFAVPAREAAERGASFEQASEHE